MKKVFLGSGILAASLATGLVAQQSSQQQPGQSGQSPAGQTSSSQRQAGQSSSQGQQGQQAQQSPQQQQQMDQMFLQEEASANLFEQQVAQLVQQKAQNQQIKALAQQIIQDHKQAMQQLQQTAQQAKVELPTEMNEVHQAKLQMMQKKQGQALELGFLWDQIGMHTKDVLEHRFMADNAQNPQIKQYAQQAGQKLQQHLAMALSAAGLDAQAVTAEIGGSKQSGAKGTTFQPSSGQQPGSQSGQSGGQSGSSSGGQSGSSSGGSSGGSSTGGSSSTPK